MILTSKDSGGNTLQTETLSFTTTVYGEDITAIEDAQCEKMEGKKIIRNGQVYILRNGKTYTITGVQVR